MRFVAGHMDGFFNHPLHYIQWVTTGPQKSRLGKGLQKLLRKEGTEISDTNKLFDEIKKYIDENTPVLPENIEDEPVEYGKIIRWR